MYEVSTNWTWNSNLAWYFVTKKYMPANRLVLLDLVDSAGRMRVLNNEFKWKLTSNNILGIMEDVYE